jgi:sterol desaturase/sphingolipid hydroxylase (fatty acid hydroxylase superfamily)
MIEELIANYNLLGSVLSLAGIVVVTKLGKYLLFKVPAMAETKQLNREQDKLKLAKDKYPPMVKASQKVGLYCNLTFFLLVLPFCVTLATPVWWQVLLDIVLVLMFYDFFYYLMHRFWFHGQGKMRQVHAVHHQARSPTYIDAHYVHPTETFLGLSLFFLSIALMAAMLGPFHVATVVLLYVLYVQLNQVNHTKIDLPYFPYRLLTWITAKHHKHHENMHKGNYATITLLYDKMFGTYE